jgi:hypothetical protein
MSFAEAGDILLTNRNPDITLGFVSAVQRGYDVCVSRVLPAPAPNGDATTASGDPAEQSASAAASCSKRSAGAANSPAAGSPDSRASNDSILARLDAEITQLRKGENTSPELSSESSSKSASQTSSGAGGAARHERMSQGVGASTPEQESEAVKQLKAQNQALTDAMQQLRETAQASEERAAAAEIRAAALEELVKEAERRAKASGRPVKTLFRIIKSRARGMCCESDPFALAQRPVWR